MSDQLACFELYVTAIDKPTERRRWNGGPLASSEADKALGKAVNAFTASLRDDGFEIVTTGYGVHAKEGMYVKE